MSDLLVRLQGLLIVASIYFFINCIVLIISLWKIFKKENIPQYYAFIPFLNIYKYYKICGLPFWTIFIPVVNIIVFICSPYVIVKKYRCKKWQCMLAILFPFIFLPFIAFSDKKNINYIYDNTYIKNIKDIDNLENHLKNDTSFVSELDLDNSNIVVDNSLDSISEIENDIINDEIIYDDIQENNEVLESNNKIENNENDFIEINDDVDINTMSLSEVETLENNIEISNTVEKKIEKNIEGYKQVGPSEEAIAFGGKKVIENIYSVQTKNDELKCKRCGSSLVGAVNNICPGCGAPINSND